MTDMIVSFIITVVSILLGYHLGYNQRILPEKISRKIKEKTIGIITRAVPNTDLGSVPRPSAKDNFYRDNPKVRQEDDIMSDTFDTLNNRK